MEPDKNGKEHFTVFCVTDFWFPKIGGMERSIDNLLRSLPSTINIQLLTADMAEPGEGAFPYATLRLPVNGNDGFYTAAYERIASQPAPKIVHVFGFSFFWPEAQARFINSLCELDDTAVVMKVPTSGDSHNYLTGTHVSIRESVHRFIALTENIAEELRRCGIPLCRIARIPNGVRTDYFKRCSTPSRHDAKKRYGLPRHRPVAGFCGRFEQRKRIDLLVSAVKALPLQRRPVLALAGYSDATFGTGVDPKHWESEDVVLLGPSHDILPFYNAIDCYISASEREGMSNAVLEAMACGLPIIASDIPGHRELVKPFTNGLLFKAGDDRDLAGCLDQAMSGSNWQGQLTQWGDASRETAVRNYDAGRVMLHYENLYMSLLPGGEAPAAAGEQH